MRTSSLVLFSIIFILLNSAIPQVSGEYQNALQTRYFDCLKLMGEKEYGTAVHSLRKLLEENPDFKPGYRKLVDAFVLNDSLEQARSFFSGMLDANPENACAWYALAKIDIQQEKYDEAIPKLKKCIALDPSFIEAYGPNGGLPAACRAMENLDPAIRFFREIISTSPQNANAWLGLGLSYFYQYDWEQAEPMLQKSLELDPDLIYAYYTLFNLNRGRMKYQKAMQAGKSLLALSLKLNDVEMVSYAFSKMGSISFFLGNFRRALAYFNESLKVARKIGDIAAEAGTLNDIGGVYAFLGNVDKGLEYFQQSLVLFRKTGLVRREIQTLYNIGLAHKDKQENRKALEFFQQSTELATRSGFASLNRLNYTGSAEAYLDLHEYRKAQQNFEDAMQIARETHDRALEGYILRNLGTLNYNRGHYEKALNNHGQALEIGIEAQDAQIIWEAHAGLGAAYEKLKMDGKAIDQYSQAIAIFDSIRQDLDIQSLSSGFLQDKYEVYPSLIHLFATQKKPDRAFMVAEKYKARSLLNILSKSQFLLSTLIPDSIFAQLNEIRLHMSVNHESLSEELAKAEPDRPKILELDQKIAALQLKKDSLIAWVRETQKSYYQITSSEPLTVKEVQSTILDPRQVLVEFVVGPERTSVFALTKDSLYYREISISRVELDTMMGNLSPMFRQRSSDKVIRNGATWSPELADFSVEPAFKLYELLLKPLEPVLRNRADLIIVPDDFLNYLPFEALVTDTTGTRNRYDFSHAKLLLEKFNISYSSSVSALNPSLQVSRNPVKNLLAMGNPDFSIPEDSDNSRPDSARMPRGPHFLPLPNSEAEVKGIEDLVNGKGDRVYTGQAANEGEFKSRAADFRLIHLATHFISDDSEPMYSKIVFSQNLNSKDDGLLQTYEIFDMHLNADLVVLSACNTALGKLSKGEGLIGVTRAFQYAGVPGLVVSLWSVEDEATQVIMESFYHYLKSGMTRDAALRNAKLDYLKSADDMHKDPFYWAPFIVVGDRSPVKIEKKSPIFIYGLFTFLALVIAATGMILKRK